jgi:hypothetical protein
VPYPSPADYSYIVDPICFLVGIYLLKKGLGISNERIWLGVMISSTLIILSLAGTFIVGRNWQLNLEGDPIKIYFDIAYPTFDAVGIGMLVYIIRGSIFASFGKQMQWMLYWIATGLLVQYFADAIFSITTSLPDGHSWAYHDGGLDDMIFVTAFWVLGMGVSLIPQFYKSKATE